jgi:hypothetical protein
VSNLINFVNEKSIIKQTRENYKKYQIEFKTAHKIQISIQTERTIITYPRYLLIPKTSEDLQRLKDLEGKRGIFPLDIALGVANLPHNMTVKAMLKISKVAQAASSYKHASEILADDHGIKLDPATIMNVTNHIGDLAFKNEMAKADECYNTLLSGRMVFPQNRKDGVLYIEMDGAFVNTREKSENSNSSWHENKLGVVFSSDDKREVQKRSQDTHRESILNGLERKRYFITRKNYTAYIGSVDTFKKLLLNCAIRGGYGKYKETVIISDGATWIRNLKDELFYDAQQILDFYHLCEKVWDFGKQYFKINITLNNHNTKYNQTINESDETNYANYKIWCEHICLLLLKSHTKDVLEDIIKKEKELKYKKNFLSHYIINNKNAIDYATYLQKGYDIGSGAIESANKSVLQKRLDGPGMRWHLESAQNIVTLRAKVESGKWYEDVVIPVRKHYKLE